MLSILNFSTERKGKTTFHGKSFPLFSVFPLKPYPCCPNCQSSGLEKRGTKQRTVTDDTGQTSRLILYRLYCPHCHHYHMALPVYIVPWKRYTAKVIENSLGSRGAVFVPAETRTASRQRRWLLEKLEYFAGVLEAMKRLEKIPHLSSPAKWLTRPDEKPGTDALPTAFCHLSQQAEKALERIQIVVGTSGNLLMAVVQILVNAKNWFSTQLAVPP